LEPLRSEPDWHLPPPVSSFPVAGQIRFFFYPPGRGFHVFLLIFLSFFSVLFFFFFRFFFFFFFWNFPPVAADKRDFIANVHLPAFFHVNFGERSVLGRFPFHRRLVAFDFSNDFPGRNFVALFLFPRNERPLGHGVAQFRHLNFGHGSLGVADFFHRGH